MIPRYTGEMNPYDPRYPPPPPNPYGAPPGPPPYGAPYPPPMPYSPYGMGYPPPANDSEATTIFVLGLCGLLVCQILAPIAWIKGQSYRSTCMAMGVAPSGLGTAGWILGIVGTVMLGLTLVWVLFVLLLGAAGA